MGNADATSLRELLTFVSAGPVTITRVMLGLLKLPAHPAYPALATSVSVESIGVPVPGEIAEVVLLRCHRRNRSGAHGV